MKSSIKKLVVKSSSVKLLNKKRAFTMFRLNSARVAMESEYQAQSLTAGVERAKEAMSLYLNCNRQQLVKAFQVWR